MLKQILSVFGYGGLLAFIFVFASHARRRCNVQVLQPLCGENAYFGHERSRAMSANAPASIVLRSFVFQHLERHAHMECIDGHMLQYTILMSSGAVAMAGKVHTEKVFKT